MRDEEQGVWAGTAAPCAGKRRTATLNGVAAPNAGRCLCLRVTRVLPRSRATRGHWLPLREAKPVCQSIAGPRPDETAAVIVHVLMATSVTISAATILIKPGTKSEKKHIVSLLFVEENIYWTAMRVVAGVAILVVRCRCRSPAAARLAVTWPHAADASPCSCCKPVVCCRDTRW